AASTLSTSSPRRAKSAERIEGAMTVGCMEGLVLDVEGTMLATPAFLADAVVGTVDLGGALLGLLEQFGRGAGHAVGVVLRHQAPVGEVDFRIAGIAL